MDDAFKPETAIPADAEAASVSGAIAEAAGNKQPLADADAASAPGKFSRKDVDRLTELTKDAVNLIEYVSAKGDPLDQKTISAIYTAQQAITRNACTDEITVNFFTAYANLSKRAQPITPQSLRDSENASVKRAINRWSFGVFFLLPILVGLSSLSYANGQFVANAEKWIRYSNVIESPKPSYPTLEDLPPNDISPKPTTVGVAPDPTATPSDRRVEDIEFHNDLLFQTVAQMLAHQTILADFTRYRLISSSETFLPKPDLNSEVTGARELGDGTAADAKDRARAHERKLSEMLRTARINLNIVLTVNKTLYGVVSTYLLPLLCALLGATAFGLRTLSTQTQARTYRASYVPYARTISAVIVGFAVGLFSDFTAKLTLQPLATAFIAGYGVEAFFVFLDSLLQAVQKPPA